MAISINVSRPKLVGTTVETPIITAKPIVESGNSFEIPICYDNLTTTPVILSDVSIETGSSTVTGLEEELSDVKIGSVFVTADDTTDFAAGTYVIAKPSPTTITLSTSSLTTKANTVATTTLTVDATALILRITPVGSSTTSQIRFNMTASVMTGNNAIDPNGNGYDEVTYEDGDSRIAGAVVVDFDNFATSFGLQRTN